MMTFSFSIPESHPAIAGHFPNNPLVPGVVILERVLHGLRNLRQNSTKPGTALVLPTIQIMKFKGTLLTDEIATVLYTMRADACSFVVFTLRDQQAHRVAEGKLTFETIGAAHDVDK